MAGRTIFFDDVRAGYVGRHQVGGELNALERQIQNARHGFNQQRLRESGTPLTNECPPTKKEINI